MQARYPDINSSFITQRKKADICLVMGNYAGCTSALYAYNSLFPIEHQITISSSKFIEATKQSIKVKCNECGEEFERNDIRVFDILVPILVSIVTKQRTEKIWICKECKADNILSKTNMTKIVIAQPNFLRIVPFPPERSNGLMDIVSYHSKYQKWAYNFMIELEHSSAMYREAGIKQDDDLEEQGLNLTEGLENQN